MDKVTIELKENWRFHLGECEEAWYKGYDDSGWREVMVPHDWSVEAPFSKAYSSGTGYLQGGTGWYRVRFHLPEEYRGKSVRICFDGVYKNSQVFCNSYYLGKRPNGYVSFSYDISRQAVFGEEENEVSVKVTHNDLADSRWFTGSGITRKVTVLVEEPVHPAEYGCAFRTEQIFEKDNKESSAQISVVHEPVNDSAEKVKLSVRTVFLDRQGRTAAELSGDLELYGSGVIKFEKLVDSADKVVEGDKIVTSNISDKYLPGILIGYISSLDVDSNNLTKSGLITPAVDFEHLEEVLVVTKLKQTVGDD